MKFKVFHSDDPSFSLKEETLEREASNFPIGFTHVADVECRSLGEVFRLTNHINSDWRLNKEVESFDDPVRSTSVGDCVVDPDGNVNLCLPLGWKIIPLGWKVINQ